MQGLGAKELFPRGEADEQHSDGWVDSPFIMLTSTAEMASPYTSLDKHCRIHRQ